MNLPLSSTSQPETQEPVSDNPLRKPMFGNLFYQEVYNLSKQIARDNGVYRIYRLEKDGNREVILICGVLRIIKISNGNIHIQQLNLTTNKWVVTKRDLGITLLPFKSNGNKTLWVNLLSTAIRYVIDHACSVVSQDVNLASHARPKPVKHREMLDLVKRVFIQSVTGKYNPKTSMYDKGRFNNQKMLSACNGIRAYLWKSFIDKQVLACCLRVDFSNLSLKQYILFHNHRKHVFRINHESKNLLPFMNVIPPEHWSDLNLFSKEYWVPSVKSKKQIRLKSGFSTGLALVDSTKRYPPHLHPVGSVRSWNWIKSSSIVVNRYLVSIFTDSMGNNTHEIVTRLANVSASINNARIPVIAWMEVLKFIHRKIHHSHFFSWDDEREGAKLMDAAFIAARLFLIESAKIWEREGYNKLREKIKHDESLSFKDMLDFIGRMPDVVTPKSTWKSLYRHSAEWHRKIAYEVLQDALNSKDELRSWESKVETLVCGDVTFTAINDELALARHGYEMNHCVGSYADSCAEGQYRVYMAINSLGYKGTLGLSISKRGKAETDQFRGRSNHALPKEMGKTEKEFVVQYNKIKKASLAARAVSLEMD